MSARLTGFGLALFGLAWALAGATPALAAGCPSAKEDAEYAQVLGRYDFTGDSQTPGLKFVVDCVYPGGSLIVSQAARQQGLDWHSIMPLEGYYDRSSKSIHLPTLGVIVKHIEGTWRARFRVRPDDLYRTVTFEHSE